MRKAIFPHVFLILGLWVSTSALGQKWEGGKLELEQAIDLALERNLSVKLASISLDMAEENKRQAYMGMLPTLNGFASHGFNWGQTIDPFTNQFASNRVRSNSLSLSSNWTLFGGLQQQNLLAQRKAEEKASSFDLEQNKNSISINVAQAYLQLVFNAQLLEISEEQLALSKQQLERVKRQFEIGQVAQSNYLDMQAQTATDELSLINSKNQYEMSRLQLAQMLQLGPDEQFEVSLPELDAINAKMVQGSARSVYEQALEFLPDVKASEYRLQASEKGMAAARGGYSPRLSINANYGSGYSGNNKIPVGDPTVRIDTSAFLFTENGDRILQLSLQNSNYEAKAFKDQINDNINQSLSFSLSIPIFNGHTSRSNVNRSKLSVMQAKYQLDQARNTLRQTVETAWNDALAAYKRLVSSEKAAEAQELAFENARLRFEQNAINSYEFNDFKVRMARAQSDLIQARIDYIFKTQVLEFYKGENLSLK